MKIKRDELKALSTGFKILVKEGALDSVNEGLVSMYAQQGHTELKTYRQWKETGFQVRKGSKALLLWGEPKPIRKGSGEAPAPEEKEDTFFPLAYVFSNLQVEPAVSEYAKR